MSDDKAQAGQQEPSMEDILSSIRKILSEDGDERTPSDPNEMAAVQASVASVSGAATGGAAGSPARPPAAAGSDPGNDEEAAPSGTEPPPAAAEQEAHITEQNPQGATPEPELDVTDVLELTQDMRAGPVVSAPTAVTSTDVLAQLAKAILNRRDMAIGSKDVTLESMVREMLRPLLKEWLDRNLPYLIERLVKKEIDKMINRAERLED